MRISWTRPVASVLAGAIMLVIIAVPGRVPIARAATASPGRLVFYTTDGPVSMLPDGSGSVGLGSQVRRYPVISPDGSEVAGDTHGGDLWMDGITGGDRALISLEGHTFFTPSFTPNGEFLTTVHHHRHDWDVVNFDPDTRRWTEITHSNQVREWAPSWSPDGSQLAFWSDAGATPGVRILDVATDEMGAVVMPTDVPVRVDWSPDGNTLAYGQPDEGLVTLDLSMPGAEPVLNETIRGDVMGASWAPDGRILFAGTHSGGSSQLYTVGTDGTDIVQVTFGGKSKTYPDQAGIFLEISLSKEEMRFGQSVQLSIHLYPVADTDNDAVKLFRSVAGDRFKAFASRMVDADGDLTIQLDPSRNTIYYARWEGDASTRASSSRRVHVVVKPLFKAALQGFYSTSGRYRLYREGSTIRYRVTLLPFQAGKAVDLYIDFHDRGGWHYADNIRFGTSRRGLLTLGIRGLPKGAFRLYSFFHGNRSNPEAKTGFQYVRVT